MTKTPHCIAIIDDDRETLQLLEEILRLEGYRVISFTGETSLFPQIEAVQPSAILLDVMIACYDGYALCQQIKQNKALHQVPVVFISGMTAPEDQRRGIEAGASGYLTKPFLLDTLYGTLRALLGPRVES